MSGKVGTYTLVMSFIRKASIDVAYLGIYMSHLTYFYFLSLARVCTYVRYVGTSTCTFYCKEIAVSLLHHAVVVTCCC